MKKQKWNYFRKVLALKWSFSVDSAVKLLLIVLILPWMACWGWHWVSDPVVNYVPCSTCCRWQWWDILNHRPLGVIPWVKLFCAMFLFFKVVEFMFWYHTICGGRTFHSITLHSSGGRTRPCTAVIWSMPFPFLFLFQLFCAMFLFFKVVEFMFSCWCSG